MTTALLWLDLETTGLEPTEDRILEVAWKLTDAELNDKMVDIRSHVVTPSGDTLDILKANPFVLDMHTKTGLAHELTEPHTLLLEDVEADILSHIEAGTSPDDDIQLAGASVHFDRTFIKQYMPRLHERLHHRVYDTSTLKSALGRFLTINVENAGQHRAANDVAETLEVARRVDDAMVYADFVMSYAPDALLERLAVALSHSGQKAKSDLAVFGPVS